MSNDGLTNTISSLFVFSVLFLILSKGFYFEDTWSTDRRTDGRTDGRTRDFSDTKAT